MTVRQKWSIRPACFIFTLTFVFGNHVISSTKSVNRQFILLYEINPLAVLSGNQRLLDRSGRFDRHASYSHKEPTSATAIKALPHIEFIAFLRQWLSQYLNLNVVSGNSSKTATRTFSIDVARTEESCSGVVTRNRTDVLLGYTLMLQPIKSSNECMIMHTTVMQLLSLFIKLKRTWRGVPRILSRFVLLLIIVIARYYRPILK